MRRVEFPFLLLGLLALIAYALTSPPGITWNHSGEDGAELAAVGQVLGVAHPTGYPLYSLILRIASLGTKESARRATLVTNLAAAAAVFLTGLVFFEVARRALPESRTSGKTWSVALTAGLCLAAIFASGRIWWSQSNIIEVYALHVFFVALALYVAITLRGSARTIEGEEGGHAPGHVQKTSSSPSRFRLLAYIAGLALAHHLQIALLGPSFLVLCLADRSLRNRNLWIAAAAFAILPLSLYGTLVVRSRLDPPLDWGNPESLKQLLWVIRGDQYHYRLFSAPIAEVLERVRTIGGLLPAQFGWTAFPLGFVGLAVLIRSRETTLVTALGLYLLLQTGFALNYSIPDYQSYLIPVTLVWGAFSAAGAAILIRAGSGGRRLAWVALSIILLGPLASLPDTWKQVTLRHDTEAEDYAREAIAAAPASSLILSDGDGRSFSLWYRAGAEKRHDLTIIYRALLVWPWYLDNLRKLDQRLVLEPENVSHYEFERRILTDQISKRSVFTTFMDDRLAKYFTVLPEGRLFRVAGVRHGIEPPDGVLRTKPVKLLPNADYRLDPFRPGRSDSAGLYPGLEGGTIYWGSLPFDVPSPNVLAHAVEQPPNVFAPARQPFDATWLPLSPDSTHMVCVLMDGGRIDRSNLRLGMARVYYQSGPPDTVEIRSHVNVWDYNAESSGVTLPEDVVAWRGPLDQSLTVLPIPTDSTRIPTFLELTGDSPPGESGAAAAYAVFAVTQWLK